MLGLPFPSAAELPVVVADESIILGRRVLLHGQQLARLMHAAGLDGTD